MLTLVLPCPVHGKEEEKMRNPLKPLVEKFGLPRVIIVSFFLFLIAAAGMFQMNLMQLTGATTSGANVTMTA